MLFQYSIGIDVKDGILTGVLLKGSVKGVEMAAHDERSVREKSSLGEMSQDILSLIKRLGSEIEMGSVAVYIGIPRGSAIIRELVFPYAVKENLQKTLQYELEKYVPFTFEDCYFDYQIVGQNKDENNLKVLLNVVKRDVIDSLIELLTGSGIGLSGLEVSSTAAVNALEHFRHKDQAERYIYAKEENGSTDLLFVENALLKKSILSRKTDSVDGMKAVAKEIISAFQGNTSLESETLKCWMFPSAVQSERIFSIVESAGVQFNSMEWMPREIDNDALLSAYGLALKGVGHVPMQINMLSRERRKPIGRRGIYLMFVLVGVLILSGAFWAGSFFLHEKLTMDRLNDEINALKPEANKISRVETEIYELEHWLTQLKEITNNNGIFLDIVKELSERIPTTAWIKEIKYTSKGIEISGFAESAADIIPALEESSMFKDVYFLSATEKEKDGGERFRIGFQLE